MLQGVIVIVFIRCFEGWYGRASAPIEWLAMIASCFEWRFLSCLLSSEIIFCVVMVNDETIVMFIFGCSYCTFHAVS